MSINNYKTPLLLNHKLVTDLSYAINDFLFNNTSPYEMTIFPQ